LALACTCTSWGPAFASEPEQALELSLARQRALYIRLPIDHPELQVKVRGVVLQRIPVKALRVAYQGSVAEASELPELRIPVVWRVGAAPEAEWRRVVAPPTLVPYSEDAAVAGTGVTPSPQTASPAQYDVELASGWVLHVGPSPPTGWLSRLAGRLRSGWCRLWGRPLPQPPPSVAVVMDADDARRALHLFREGLEILVVRGDGASPAASPTARTPGSPVAG